MKGYGQNILSFYHPLWVDLNTYTRIINEFPPFNYLPVKMGSGFSLFSAIRLAVSKTYPVVIVSVCKICLMLSFLYPSLL